ncbi:hypothetical protein GTY73_06160 [Streptomyces sp. SID8354]|nr:hypothetical protein [Streptomyces sp. SID8354]
MWSAGFVRGPASADALSKYENSGAHGTDPPPPVHRVSSGWDGGLTIWAQRGMPPRHRPGWSARPDGCR